ncbi:TetR/AcrR family transcriptional regulator [Shewanella pneumatophori]|uniref:TetR/AcrR family transcriptional regulator n=1 Tax=Shewanella pneumatophori TaxID=314092 RepID=A0A9X1ZQS0_9GAMM|nr:TetR/AcrR family transcriptional regulator [Shewanella pneumatophori]MCL1140301.1 TetR/AcrR family transcriptional regulator [Shewanella pneumatophori]
MAITNTKGRPAQISKVEVIECALHLGLHNFSMHSLAKKLGVSATALYRHVSSREELIICCCDYVMQRVDIPTETQWQQYLYAFARNFRDTLLATPNSVQFIRHNQQFTPATCILVNDALGIFRADNFDAEVGFMAFACVYTRVTDIVQHQEQARANSADKQELTVDAEALPNLAWLFSQTKPVDYQQYFEDGIKITLEGLKAVYGK